MLCPQLWLINKTGTSNNASHMSPAAVDLIDIMISYILLAKYPKLAYFFMADWLVALVPISSAAMKHIFSQVKFTVATTGVNVFE